MQRCNTTNDDGGKSYNVLSLQQDAIHKEISYKGVLSEGTPSTRCDIVSYSGKRWLKAKNRKGVYLMIVDDNKKILLLIS